MENLSDYIFTIEELQINRDPSGNIDNVHPVIASKDGEEVYVPICLYTGKRFRDFVAKQISYRNELKGEKIGPAIDRDHLRQIGQIQEMPGQIEFYRKFRIGGGQI